ncbi:MucR family transcriptional regulator [Sphingomonas glacialis]|uniref:MucR family transcriptional regulator n=1 Tax=Sphingomonas glacialis TaxID=658225 RepID=A0ABQ3LXZ8_9SPHN|nr:MucR family transcriptional regulator [Sphingomonas glacialis]GHH24270.1 MucR family transcriptional regulator [Sphingomonas glacialis]
MSDENAINAVELATDLTIAWLSNQNNRLSPEDVPAFLRTMHATLTELATGATGPDTASDHAAADPQYTPAVTARRSLSSKDHIVSMIDGKPYKTLRRHLSTHGMTPEEYRQRYNLKADYPMVAENYSAARRDMALKIGLGAKGRQAKATVVPAPAEKAPAKRGRKPAQPA